MTFGAASALFGAAGLVYGFVRDLPQAIHSYWFAYLTVFTTIIGALFVLMILNSASAKWFVPLRRSCEHVVGAFPLIVAAVAPMLVFLEELYPWTRPQALTGDVRDAVVKKLWWLDRSFFTWRSILYLVVIGAFIELLRRWSLQQDAAKDQVSAEALRTKMVRTSVVGLMVCALTVTLASFDWVMSLSPAWWSDLFGVYVFAGGMVAAFGLLGGIAVHGRRRRWLPEEIGPSHFHALGRLQLTFVIFWAYIGYVHVNLQWLANLPLEAIWWLPRWSGGWGWVGVALIVLHFGLPFLALLSRELKRRAAPFFGVSAWLVVVHLVDVYYLVLPELHERGLRPHWLDPLALMALLGATLGFGAWRAGDGAAVPIGDPLLVEGLGYESAS